MCKAGLTFDILHHAITVGDNDAFPGLPDIRSQPIELLPGRLLLRHVTHDGKHPFRSVGYYLGNDGRLRSPFPPPRRMTQIQGIA